MNRLGILALAGYLACIVAANWLVQNVGIVTVAPGLVAPAGVFAVGVALTLRDATQRTLGITAVVFAILAGAALSYLIAPSLAIASGCAFLISEAADLLVYTPLERRGYIAAVAVSNIIGALVDSVVFLWLAFGSLAFLKGQFVGKVEMTALAVLILAFAEGWRAASRELAR